MQQKDNLVRVILTSGEGEKEIRLHVKITKEAEERALELLDKEKAPITDRQRTQIYYQAMKEFSAAEE